MSVLSDKQIAERCTHQGMIEPWFSETQRNGKISFGMSSYGYDIRVGNEFKVFTNVHNTVIDPKDFRDDAFVTIQTEEYCIVPPNSFALAVSAEYFRIPRDILALCVGKSTFARCGVIVNVTPLEPQWEGFLTIEISNTTPLPAKIYANEGIAQLIFFSQFPECEVSYADKKGKYQNQIGITTAKL
jgi:dCTP deaminase